MSLINPSISVIIPCYNEQRRIEKTLISTLAYLKKNFKKYEVVVVDDGSTDKTLAIVSKFKGVRIIRNKTNKGKGYSVKRGIISAKYPLTLVMDADLATPIEETRKLMRYFKKGYKVIIGSRRLTLSRIITNQTKFRKLLGDLFVKLTKFLVPLEIKDTQCGFKLFESKTAKKLFKLQTRERFSFDVELLLIAKRLKVKVKEVPITWINQEGSTVRPIKDGLKMVTDLIIIKKNDLLKKYR